MCPRCSRRVGRGPARNRSVASSPRGPRQELHSWRHRVRFRSSRSTSYVLRAARFRHEPDLRRRGDTRWLSRAVASVPRRRADEHRWPAVGEGVPCSRVYPEWNMNQAVAVFRAMPGLENKYLMYVLMSPSALRWMKGRAKTTAGQTNLTLETCRDVPIPLPPLAEQRRIASTLDAKL